MASIIFIFTLWCGISKGDPNTNSYGQIE